VLESNASIPDVIPDVEITQTSTAKTKRVLRQRISAVSAWGPRKKAKSGITQAIV
jgi:hypothetical protein